MRISFVCASLLVGILLAWSAASRAFEYYMRKPQVHAHVFIHGTVFTVLSMLDMRGVMSDEIQEDSPYYGMLSQVRKNLLLFHDQILLEEGWHKVPDHVIPSFHNKSLNIDDKKKAAYHFTPAYHAFAQKYFKKECDHKYYLFGHLGMLTQAYRKKAAQELYDHLCKTIDDLQHQYHKVRLTIVCHSHGGNIALNLVTAEEKYQRGLVIDDLVLYGMPVQVETAAFAYNRMFKRVINCYSDGDSVQNNDRFSTKTRQSHKIFSDSLLEIERIGDNKLVYDVRLLVNSNTKTIGHANMWLFGRSDKATDALDPLPIAVLTPIMLDLIDKSPSYTHIDCNILEGSKRFKVILSQHKQDDIAVSSDNIYLSAIHLRDLTLENWVPADTSRMLLLNYQTGATLWQAFKSWRQAIKEKAIAFTEKVQEAFKPKKDT